jgi:hypothetical protein
VHQCERVRIPQVTNSEDQKTMNAELSRIESKSNIYMVKNEKEISLRGKSQE